MFTFDLPDWLKGTLHNNAYSFKVQRENCGDHFNCYWNFEGHIDENLSSQLHIQFMINPTVQCPVDFANRLTVLVSGLCFFVSKRWIPPDNIGWLKVLIMTTGDLRFMVEEENEPHCGTRRTGWCWRRWRRPGWRWRSLWQCAAGIGSEV